MELEPGSLVKLRFGKRRIDVVPVWSAVYAGALFVLFVFVLIALEKRVFPRLEQERLLPTARWEQETATINANNRGKILTDDPVWKSKGIPVAPGRTKSHRILVLGDSFAWGAALDNINDVWWRQLERELARRGHHGVEVIAACAAGASTNDELVFSRDVVQRYKPDLIIWGYVTNDPDEGILSPVMLPATANAKVADPALRRILELAAPSFPMLVYRVDYLRQAKRQVLASNLQDGLEYAERELQMLRGPNFARYRQTLGEVATFHRQTGIPGFFLTLPNFPSQEYFGPRYEPVARAMNAAGLRFYNILPAFVQRYGRLPVIRFAATPNDGHPGPISTHFYAKQCADILERDYPKFIGDRTAGHNTRIVVNDWAPFDLPIKQESNGRVTVDYPERTDGFLRMPFDHPFAQFNLASPVPMSEIRVEGSYLDAIALSWTTIDRDAGFDLRRPTTPVEVHGRRAVFRIPGDRVNTVRFAARFVDKERMPHEVSEEKLAGPFAKETGNAWSYPLAHLESVSDTSDTPTRSVLQLIENGRPIGVPHSEHLHIQKQGGGLFSHWHNYLYFSTSDDTDPNKNGRQYSIRMVKIPEDARRIRFTFRAAVPSR